MTYLSYLVSWLNKLYKVIKKNITVIRCLSIDNKKTNQCKVCSLKNMYMYTIIIVIQLLQYNMDDTCNSVWPVIKLYL